MVDRKGASAQDWFKKAGISTIQLPKKIKLQCVWPENVRPIKDKITFDPCDTRSVNIARSLVIQLPISANPVCRTQCNVPCDFDYFDREKQTLLDAFGKGFFDRPEGDDDPVEV